MLKLKCTKTDVLRIIKKSLQRLVLKIWKPFLMLEQSYVFLKNKIISFLYFNELLLKYFEILYSGSLCRDLSKHKSILSIIGLRTARFKLGVDPGPTKEAYPRTRLVKLLLSCAPEFWLNIKFKTKFIEDPIRALTVIYSL